MNILLERTYNVLQSDGNSFCGDVVLESFNEASRDEENIFAQIYVCLCSDYYYDDFISLYHYKKMHTNTTVALKPNFINSILLCAVFLLNMHFIFIIKILKYLLFIFLI